MFLMFKYLINTVKVIVFVVLWHLWNLLKDWTGFCFPHANWWFVNCTRWSASSRRTDHNNVPLQLQKVLAAMRSDQPGPAPHRDFLRCLDGNHIRRMSLKKLHNNATYFFDIFELFLTLLLWKCFAVSIQHDADEVFLAILNLMQKQMDDRELVGL